MDNNSYIKPLRPSREIKIVISVCFLLARLCDLGGCVFVMVSGAVTFSGATAVPSHLRAGKGPRKPPAAAAGAAPPGGGGSGSPRARRGWHRAAGGGHGDPPRGAPGPGEAPAAAAAVWQRSRSGPRRRSGSAPPLPHPGESCRGRRAPPPRAPWAAPAQPWGAAATAHPGPGSRPRRRAA